jgi:hypothetical protein
MRPSRLHADTLEAYEAADATSLSGLRLDYGLGRSGAKGGDDMAVAARARVFRHGYANRLLDDGTHVAGPDQEL